MIKWGLRPKNCYNLVNRFFKTVRRRVNKFTLIFLQLFPNADQSHLVSALLSNEGNTMGAIQQLLSQQSGGKGGDSNPGQLSSAASNSHFMYPSSAVSLALSIESPFSGNFY